MSSSPTASRASTADGGRWTNAPCTTPSSPSRRSTTTWSPTTWPANSPSPGPGGPAAHAAPRRSRSTASRTRGWPSSPPAPPTSTPPGRAPWSTSTPPTTAARTGSRSSSYASTSPARPAPPRQDRPIPDHCQGRSRTRSSRPAVARPMLPSTGLRSRGACASRVRARPRSARLRGHHPLCYRSSIDAAMSETFCTSRSVSGIRRNP
jgi:hypothetical protein